MTVAPAWLATFQGQFSELLRSPPRVGAEFAAPSDAALAALLAVTCPGPHLAAPARLAVYRRQYWLRLVQALRHEFRLAAALVGSPTFEHCALAFVQQFPPRHRDLAHAADGFDAFMAAPSYIGLPPGWPRELSKAALSEALYADQVFRQLFRAPPTPTWQPSASELATMLVPESGAHLCLSSAVALVIERFPLLRLRHEMRAPTESATGRLPLPDPYPDGPRSWAVVRQSTGQRIVPLSPLQGQLYSDFVHHPVAAVLAKLELACPSTGRLRLSQRVQGYLADGVALGLWTGVAARGEARVEEPLCGSEAL